MANYFGGSVAVLPVLDDGRLGDATDVKMDAGKVGPTRATNAPPGSFAFSGHDRTHAHMIQADPSGRFVLHVDLGLDKIFVWKFDEKKGTLTAERPARRVAAARRRAAALPLPPQRPLALLHPGGRLDRRAVRLRRRDGPADLPADGLHPAARVRREQLLLRDPGVGRRQVRLRRQPAARQHRHLLRRPERRPDVRRRGMDPRELPAELHLRPHRPVPVLLQPAGDNVTVFRVDRKTGGLSFTGHYTPVGNPSCIVFST